MALTYLLSHCLWLTDSSLTLLVHSHMLPRLLKHWKLWEVLQKMVSKKFFVTHSSWQQKMDIEITRPRTVGRQTHNAAGSTEESTFHSWKISLLTYKADLVISKRKWWKSMFVKSSFSVFRRRCLWHFDKVFFLTAWMSSNLSVQWLRLHARQCSVTPHKSDAAVSTTEHSRRHSCWRLGIIFPRS